MLKAPRALVVGIAAVLAPLGATARGQDPYGLGYAYLFGYGATNTPRISSFVPAPPYFALHPPVYYGQRYTRPYGDSPFASWPQLQPAAGYHVVPAAAHAKIVINPYAQAGCVDCAVDGPLPTPAESAPEASPQNPTENPPENSAEDVSGSPVIQHRPATAPLVIDNPYYRGGDADRLVATAAEAESAAEAGN